MEKELNNKITTETKRKSVYKKLFEIKTDIEKVDKDKQGYKFSYEDPEKIAEAVLEQLKLKGLDHHMEVRIPENEHEPKAFEITPVVNSKGQTEYMAVVSLKHTYVDPETGEKVSFDSVGAGFAGQPGQAVGAAKSYGQRQEFEKRFAITIDKKNNEDFELKYTVNKDGEAVEVMSDESKRKIISHIQMILSKKNKEYTPADVSQKALHYVEELNKQFGTEYKKLSAVPNEYAQDIVKIMSIEELTGKTNA